MTVITSFVALVTTLSLTPSSFGLGGQQAAAATCGGRVYGEIGQKYHALIREGRDIGCPRHDERDLIFHKSPYRGRWQWFRTADMAWSPRTGAHVIKGSILVNWVNESGRHIGFPITDELPTPHRHGRYNHFENGSIYWSPSTGAHPVRGAIREHWKSTGWENGKFGFPKSAEADSKILGYGTRVQFFECGAIAWKAGVGIREYRC